MREPAADLHALRREIEAYGRGMERKPAAVAANKIDALSDRRRLDSLEREAGNLGLPFFALSAATGEGCREMAVELHRRIRKEREGDSEGTILSKETC